MFASPPPGGTIGATTTTPRTDGTKNSVGTTGTDVDGLLSPFSPLVTRRRRETQKRGQQSASVFLSPEEKNDVMSMLSLQPCRKVSIVIRVLPIPERPATQTVEGGRSMSTSSAAGLQQVVFPHYKACVVGSNGPVTVAAADGASPIFMTPTASSSATGTTTSLSHSPTSVRDMVVVNPTAFGRNIPANMTVEVAQTVAKCAHISTEDWLRLYEFHHVIWPAPASTAPATVSSQHQTREERVEGNTELNHQHQNQQQQLQERQRQQQQEVVVQQFDTMDTICRAAALDAMTAFKSSLVISLGQEPNAIGTIGPSQSAPAQIGLWSKLLTEVQAMQDEKTVVTLTMVEILEDNVQDLSSNLKRELGFNPSGLYDVLDPKNSPNLKLRHTDMKGAILEGPTEVGLDNMSALIEGMQSRHRQRQRHRQRRQKRRQQKHASPLKKSVPSKSPLKTATNARNDVGDSHDEDSESGDDAGPGTAVVATINVWKDGVSYNLKRQPNAQITVVELSTLSNAGSGTSLSSSSFVQNRKSAINLGQALRQLLLKSLAKSTDAKTNLNTSAITANTPPSLIPTTRGVSKTATPGSDSPNKSMISQSSMSKSSIPAVSFRESTLTSVLQRSMEASKIVVVASISPLARDYENTVATLNYLRRLLVKPGKTLSSPFKSMEYEYGTPSTNEASPIFGTMPSPSPSLRGDKNDMSLRTPSSSTRYRTDDNSASKSASSGQKASSTPRSRHVEVPENSEFIQNLAHNDGMLKSLVSDPRQRLARLVEAASPGRNGSLQNGNPSVGTELHFDEAVDDDQGISDDPNRYDLPSQIDDEESLDYEPASTAAAGSTLNCDGMTHGQASATKIRLTTTPTSKLTKNSGENYGSAVDSKSDAITGHLEWYTEEEIRREENHGRISAEDINNGGVGEVAVQLNGSDDDGDDRENFAEEDVGSMMASFLQSQDAEEVQTGHVMDRLAEQYLHSVEDDNDSTFDLLDENDDTDLNMWGRPGVLLSKNVDGTLYDDDYKGIKDLGPHEEVHDAEPDNHDIDDEDLPQRTYAPHTRRTDVSIDESDQNDDDIGQSTTQYDLPDEPAVVANDGSFVLENENFSYHKESFNVNRTVDASRSTFDFPAANSAARSRQDENASTPRENNVVHQLRQEINKLREELNEEIEDKLRTSSAATATLSALEKLRFENQNLLERLETHLSNKSNEAELGLARDQLVSQLQEKIIFLETNQQSLEINHDKLVVANATLESRLKDSQIALEQARMSTEQLRNHNEQTRLEETATIQELMNQIRSNEMVVAEVHRLRAELEQAKHNQTRADAAEKKNNELTSKSAELERQLVDAKSKLRHAQSQAHELSCVTESAELRAKMKESEMESLIEKESKWNQVLCEKDATIKNLRSKYDELEKRHQDDLAALRALESDKFIEGSTIDDLEILREEVVFLENQKRQLEQKIAEKNATLETTRRQNEKDVMDLSSKFVRTQEELRIVRHELSSAHLEMALSHEQTLSLQKQVGDLLAELDSVKKQNRHLQSDSGHHRNETIYLTSKVAAQQEELNEATERADRLQDDNVHLKFLMEKMKEDFNEARVGVAEETGRHIVEITKLKNELVLAREDARKLEEQMESKNISFCKNEESLLGRLNEQKQQIDHLRSLLNQAKEEVSQSRQRATAERVEADSLVTSLRQQVNDLRQQLESADRIRQETQQLLETRSCSYEAVLLDLQQSRDGVKKRQKRIDQLSEELEERQVDLQRKDAKLYRYEMELRRLRDETKARTTSTMEKAINRAQELESDKQRLEILVNELREQRNACFDALQEGRRRLMSISQSDRVYGGSELEDILPLPYINDEADRPGLSRSPGYSRRASNDNQIHTPIIELTSSRKKPQERGADPPHIVRAEEIAACVAMNARNTLQQKEEENQHLQAKIYQLEASSKVEQEDLKIRIRRLERELGRR